MSIYMWRDAISIRPYRNTQTVTSWVNWVVMKFTANNNMVLRTFRVNNSSTVTVSWSITDDTSSTTLYTFSSQSINSNFISNPNVLLTSWHKYTISLTWWSESWNPISKYIDADNNTSPYVSVVSWWKASRAAYMYVELQ